MIEQIIFYIFGGLLILTSLLVITVRNPVYAALFLVLSFFFSAAIWLLLQAEFLAIVLILVYVGAVMVLFLFVVMMLDINLAKINEGFASYLPIAVIVSMLMAYAMSTILNSDYFGEPKMEVGNVTQYSNTEILGLELFTRYLYPFEIAGAILLVAIIAAIALTFRGSKNRLTQSPDKQVSTQRDTRVRLVKIKSKGEKQG